MKLFALLFLSLVLTSCATAQTKSSIPGELVGKWYTGSTSSLAFLDRNTGISDAAGGDGASLEIKPNGGFVKAVVVKTGLYGCSTVAFGYETGSLKIAGDTATFNGKDYFISYKDSCNPQTNSEKNKPGRKREFSYELRADDDGRDLLCLNDGNQEECFVRGKSA